MTLDLPAIGSLSWLRGGCRLTLDLPAIGSLSRLRACSDLTLHLRSFRTWLDNTTVTGVRICRCWLRHEGRRQGRLSLPWRILRSCLAVAWWDNRNGYIRLAAVLGR